MLSELAELRETATHQRPQTQLDNEYNNPKSQPNFEMMHNNNNIMIKIINTSKYGRLFVSYKSPHVVLQVVNKHKLDLMVFRKLKRKEDSTDLGVKLQVDRLAPGAAPWREEVP